jgi:hypothetical protein
VASMVQREVQIQADGARAEPIQWRSCLIPLMARAQLGFQEGPPATGHGLVVAGGSSQVGESPRTNDHPQPRSIATRFELAIVFPLNNTLFELCSGVMNGIVGHLGGPRCAASIHSGVATGTGRRGR